MMNGSLKDPMFAHFASKRFSEKEFSFNELRQVDDHFKEDLKEASTAYLATVPPFNPFYQNWVNRKPSKLQLNHDERL